MMWTEKGFGINDWYVLTVVFVIWSIYFCMPKIFSKQVRVLIILYSVVVPGLFDNSIGAKPLDFYDILDGPAYTVMDIVVYFMYAPFGYFFLYLYQRFKVQRHHLVPFIFVFAIFSVCFEWVSNKMGVFHYKNHYSFIYSVCIYLVVQWVIILFYNLIKEK